MAFVSERKLKWETIAWILLMHLGALAAPFIFSWPAFYLFLFLSWVTGGLGICLGYHRLLTHRSFKVPRFLEYLFTMFGCMAGEGGPISWVATHRMHHARSDKPGDPHSPLHGFLWSHMLWCMTFSREIDEYDAYARFAPDLAKDQVHRFLNRTYGCWLIGHAVLLFAWGGIPFLVWGVFLRSVFVYHSTWLVNSAAHTWGYQSFKTGDRSTNNWWVALLSFGEGWHNNHHAFQRSARHGLKWWEFDATFLTIRLLAFFKLASQIHIPKWKEVLISE